MNSMENIIMGSYEEKQSWSYEENAKVRADT